MELFFDIYRAHEEFFYSTQLVLAMLGMGATLSLGQFRAILRRPTSIALVVVLQFMLMPFVALMFAKVTGLPDEIAIGLVVLVALPSGSLSNIITYLGRGNVPLSITATCASTGLCLLVTPLVLSLFASHQLPDDFKVPTDKTIWSIATLLLLPLGIGMAFASYRPHLKEHLSRWAIGGSLVALGCVVVGALGGGRLDVWKYGWHTPAWIVAFVVVTLLVTYWITLLLRYPQEDAFTLAVEVSMRNGNLGVALCLPLFGPNSSSNVLHKGALYVCLFGGGAMMVIGLLAVLRRHLRFARQRRAGLKEV
ncbi:MAG: bile acid:sodium symporter family protein [Aeoliella sp.]